MKTQNLEKVRLIFFSTGESEFRQFEFNLKRAIVYFLVSAAAIASILFSSVSISSRLFQDNTHVSLMKTNSFLKKKIKTLKGNIDNLNDKLGALEKDTDDLEVIAGLASTDPDSEIIMNTLLSEQDVVMASLPVDYEYQTEKMSEYLDVLETRIERAREVQDVIEDKFLQTQNEIKHIPSIRPVPEGRVTDKFGRRRDPFVERVKHHNGIDLSARYGTKVYAAASGTVEFTRIRYRLNKGFGRVVIIKHGLGYKTLYGHLSRIDVKPGQKVDRWQVIGLSGDTGRATGPHLHYEVWHNGRPKNPEDFMLN